jgi:iron complex transport system substrate-binding protein
MKILIIYFILFNVLYGSEVRDMLNRDVHYEKAQRLVALGPGALRLVLYMNLKERLVGIERIELKQNAYIPYRQLLSKSKLSVVAQGGAGKLPNFEAIINAKPDLIISSFLSREQISLIEKKTNIPVIALSYGDSYGGNNDEKKIDAIKCSLTLLGDITNKQTRAKELLTFMQTQQTALNALQLQNTKAYIAGLGYKGAQGITSTESAYAPFEMLGIKNLIEFEARGHRFIKEETLINASPKYIFIDAMGKGMINQERKKKPYLFEFLKRKGKFYPLLASNYYNTNIENIFVNAWIIAKSMGKKVDVEAQAKEIYKTFLGADIKDISELF